MHLTLISILHKCLNITHAEVAWPSGLRRWFKAPVSSEAWVRIPPLPVAFVTASGFYKNGILTYCTIHHRTKIDPIANKTIYCSGTKMLGLLLWNF